MTTEKDYLEALTEGEREKMRVAAGTLWQQNIIKRLGREVAKQKLSNEIRDMMPVGTLERRIKQLEAENAELKAKLNEGG